MRVLHSDASVMYQLLRSEGNLFVWPLDFLCLSLNALLDNRLSNVKRTFSCDTIQNFVIKKRIRVVFWNVSETSPFTLLWDYSFFLRGRGELGRIL